MNLHKLIFTKCDSYKAATKIKPKGIMVHSTGANNPNLKRYVSPDDGLLGKNTLGNHWNKPKKGKSTHAFIGKLANGSIATYQVLPWDIKAGHAGTGKKGKAYSANNTHIAFEICEDNKKDAAYFAEVYREAVEFTAYICKMFDLDPLADGVVICHSEGYKRGIASNHGDVMHWFPKHGKSMDTFRKDVKALLSEEKGTETKDEEVYCEVKLRVLKNGDSGEDVKAMQILLESAGCKGKMDSKKYGSFGSKTEAALNQFKKKKKLPQTGKCDEVTWEALLGAN